MAFTMSKFGASTSLFLTVKAHQHSSLAFSQDHTFLPFASPEGQLTLQPSPPFTSCNSPRSSHRPTTPQVWPYTSSPISSAPISTCLYCSTPTAEQLQNGVQQPHANWPNSDDTDTDEDNNVRLMHLSYSQSCASAKHKIQLGVHNNRLLRMDST